MIACSCGRSYAESLRLPIRCPCGNQLGADAPRREPNTRGHDHVAICRSNLCGHYDAQTDACGRVIELGRIKGETRLGLVTWLIKNPDAECVAEQPLF